MSTMSERYLDMPTLLPVSALKVFVKIKEFIIKPICCDIVEAPK